MFYQYACENKNSLNTGWQCVKAKKIIAFSQCPNNSFYSTLQLWSLPLGLGQLICLYDRETWLQFSEREDFELRIYALILRKFESSIQMWYAFYMLYVRDTCTELNKQEYHREGNREIRGKGVNERERGREGKKEKERKDGGRQTEVKKQNKVK